MSKTHSVQKEWQLQFTPSLAKLCGVNAAIIIQRLQFLLSCPSGGFTQEGHHWIWNTYEQWQAEHFPFWSTKTIQRIFDDLEIQHVVVSAQFGGYSSRKKYYRLNTGMLEKLTVEEADQLPIRTDCPDELPIRTSCPDGTGQIVQMEEDNLSRSLVHRVQQKSTAESTTLTLTSEPPPAKKPRAGTLNGSKPSQDTIETFCQSIGLPRSDGEWFFHKMEGSGWTNGGKKVANWQSVIHSWRLSGYLPSKKNQNEPGTPRRSTAQAPHGERYPEFLAGHPNPKYRERFPRWKDTEDSGYVREEYARWNRTGQYEKKN